MAGSFWKPYVGQVVGGELDLVVLIGGAEERAAYSLGEVGKHAAHSNN
jgi:hypothetical protein